MNESFDILSDACRSFSITDDEKDTFSLSDPLPSPTLSKQNDLCLSKSRSANMKMPKLNKTDEDAYSLGEISPIEIAYKPKQFSKSSPSFPATKPSGEIYHQQDQYKRHPSSASSVSYVAPETPLRWAQPATVYAPPTMSNPYFVIRSASQQLAALKYILPCLSGVNVCPVNVSEYHGHIRHYQDSNMVGLDPCE